MRSDASCCGGTSGLGTLGKEHMSSLGRDGPPGSLPVKAGPDAVHGCALPCLFPKRGQLIQTLIYHQIQFLCKQRIQTVQLCLQIVPFRMFQNRLKEGEIQL